MAGFQHDIASGAGELIIPQLQSPNFDLATETGWAILKNGDAYFFDITATGSVSAQSLFISGAGDGAFIYYGGMGPGNLVVALAAASGSDKYGNAYKGPGMSVSAPGPTGKNIVQVRPDLKAILIYAA